MLATDQVYAGDRFKFSGEVSVFPEFSGAGAFMGFLRDPFVILKKIQDPEFPKLRRAAIIHSGRRSTLRELARDVVYGWAGLKEW